MAVAVDDADAVATLVAGGDDVAVGQPRFAPAGDELAFVAELDGWMNVWTVARPGDRTARACSPSRTSTRSRRGVPASVRSRGRPTRARSRCVATRTASVASWSSRSTANARSTELSKGWHTGLDWGSAGIVVHPLRWAHRAAAHRGRSRDGHATSRRRGAPAELDAVDLPEPTPITWPGTDGETVHGLLWLPPETARDAGAIPPLAGRRARRPHRPVDGRLEAPDPLVRVRGWAVLSPNYRGSTGLRPRLPPCAGPRLGRRRRQRHRRPASVPSRTTTASTRRARAVMGGSAGGFTALLVAAHAPAVVRAAVSMFGVTDLFDLAATTHRFESRYLDRLVGTLARARRPLRRRSPVAHAARSQCRCSCSRAPTTRSCRPRRRQLLVDSMRAAGGTSSNTYTRGRDTASRRTSHHRRLLRTHRRVPHTMGGPTMTAATVAAGDRVRVAGPEARCRPGGAPRARRRRRHDARALVAVADALAAAEIPSLRFNYPYRTAGSNAPDRPQGARRGHA